jgi:pentatricopeptide repeat protein
VKDKGLPLDTYCYTAVIDACAKAKLWRKALSLLEEMQQQGIEPSEVTYSVTISACGNGGQWRRALDLLDLMKSKGMSVNVITYNAVLTALSKASRQHARHISKVSTDDTTSVRMGFRKSQVTKVADDDTDDDDDDMDMSMPLDGLSPKALAILADMRSDGIEPDGFCYSSAISCCGAEGRWKEALDLMETMKRGGPRTRPNRIAYTAAISACGKAGKADQALELFQAMKNEGLSADRVAYNTLFSALRVAGDADRTFELWGEICGTRSTATKTVIATAKDFASPDIITLTDCIATLSRAGRLGELDQVFEEGVSRGIILRNNTLDLQWETDLSGMSLPVARAAIRYILHQFTQKKTDPTQLRAMTYITGIGMAQQRRRDDAMASTKGSRSKQSRDPTTSLRDHVQAVLREDFQPSIESVIPLRAQGTVEIPKDKLIQWIRSQS